jgi:chromate transporter
VKEKNIYLQLYFQALFSGLFLVGANSYLAIARKNFVEKLGWLTDEDLLSFSVMAESVPGGNVCNFFTMVGFKVAGVFGAVLMYLGVITAPITFMTVIAIFYDYFVDNPMLQFFMQGMTAGTCAIIVGVIIDISGTTAKSRGLKVFWITGAAFVLNYFMRLNLAWIILMGVAASVVTTVMKFRKQEAAKGQL